MISLQPDRPGIYLINYVFQAQLPVGASLRIVPVIGVSNEPVSYTHLDEGRYFTSREGVALPIGHCFAGTDGWKLYGRVGELVSEAPEGRVHMLSLIHIFPAPRLG